MRARLKIIGIFFIYMCFVPSSGKAQSVDYKAQVLFMYNFIKYANWPVVENNFTIVVLGNSPITTELNKLASIKKTPEGKSITVLQTLDVNTITGCQMLYVTEGLSKEMPQIMNFIKDKSILIIGQRDGLVKKGAGINFFTQDDDRLGFTISLKNVEARKIKIAGELLRLAEVTD
ncbi:MAG TPA: YfiR family protein [Cyclobacteriaceae bacterium]|nr:YfiR family protein [Cyclobacteriaceae bacterium]